MSKFRDFQQKALNYLKRGHNEREEFKFNLKVNEGQTSTPECETSPNRYNFNEESLKIAQSLLIDHELLKPLEIKIEKTWLCYLCLLIWILFMCNRTIQIKWFLFGCISTLMIIGIMITFLYISVYSSIEYRSNLLNYYSNELERLKNVTPTDNTKYLNERKKRKGWVYLTEKYEKATFNVSQLVLAYAILQDGNLVLYVIDEKFSFKQKHTLDSFNNLIKKMKSCQKIALDVNEIKIELVPHDLSYGRVWNKKMPIKIITDQDLSCIIDVEAPASIFVDTTLSRSKADLVTVPLPAYHRSTPLRIQENTFYLFGLNGREKERWHYCITESCVNKKEKQLTKHAETSVKSYFGTYIEDTMKKSKWVHDKLTVRIKTKNNDGSNAEVSNPHLLMASSMFSFNVMFSRLFWDFWRHQSWNTIILSRIQRSLNRLPLPPFLKFLKADDLNIGDSLPLIFSAEKPILDDDGGIWINCPLYYDGKFSLTINSQINNDLYNNIVNKDGEPEIQCQNSEIVPVFDQNPLTNQLLASENSPINSVENMDKMDLQEDNLLVPDVISPPPPPARDLKLWYQVSGIRKNSSSSSQLNSVTSAENISSAKGFDDLIGSKMGKLGGKVSTSDLAKKIYQSAVNHLENSSLSLYVMLTLLKGTLTLYFPPPPTDRVWFGFRTMPVMTLSVKSRIGNHKIRKFPLVTQWIERKLKEEFRDVLVLPSMDDLYLPFMSSNVSKEQFEDKNSNR